MHKAPELRKVDPALYQRHEVIGIVAELFLQCVDIDLAPLPCLFDVSSDFGCRGTNQDPAVSM